MADRDQDLSASPIVHEQHGQTGDAADDSAAMLVYTTFPSAEDAKRIGRVLVESRVAACVNIFPHMTSLYVWEGKLQEDGESAMIIKTTRGRVEKVLAEIKRLHPYSIPARLVVPLAGGGEDFLHWIAEQCSEPS
jgi:periplasmic divalent cation tolerance protein